MCEMNQSLISGNMDLVKVLLDNEANIDQEDGLGRRTPLYIAAKNKNSEMCSLLISHGASTLNTAFGKTVQEVIEEEMPYFDTSKVEIVKKPRRNSLNDFGYGLNRILDQAAMNLRKKQSNSQTKVQFKTLLSRFNATNLDNFNAEGMSLLQKACEYGLTDFSSMLLEQGANPNQTVSECGTAPLLFTAYHGHVDLLDLFINHKISSIESTNTADFSVIERTSGESLLHHLLNIPNRIEKSPEDMKNYEKCLDLILDCEDTRVQNEILKVINHKDSRQNVPLHYATNLWPQTIVRKLLERGANVGIKNVWDELPISKILPETMEDFLNEQCLRSNGHPVTSEDLEMIFDYSFLAPPMDEEMSEREQQELIDRQALPETECLWYMGQLKTHRHLLKHPVVTSFLWLKWQKIRGYFHRNLRFYLLFVTALTWYIFARYGGISTRLHEYNGTLIKDLNETGFCSELSLRTYDMDKGPWIWIFVVQTVVQVKYYTGVHLMMMPYIS